MLLAAGRGQRLRPLTDDRPKPLVPLCGRALIEYPLQRLAQAGVSEVVINLGYRGEQIRQHLGDRFADLRIRYSEEGDPPLETGGGIFRALPLLGDAPFLLLNADVYCDLDLQGLTALGDAWPQADLAHLVLVPVPAFQTVGDFAFQDGRIIDGATPSHTYSGMAVLSPSLFAGSRPGRYPLAPLLRQAAAQQRLSARCFDGLWSDVGTPQRLADLEAVLSGRQGGVC